MAIPLDLASLASSFAFSGELAASTIIESGHINRTLHLTYTGSPDGEKSYLLQKINSAVFQNVPLLMDNIAKLLNFFKNEPREPSADLFYGEEPELVLTKDGSTFCRDATGSFWRAYTFIDGTVLKAGEAAGGSQPIG